MKKKLLSLLLAFCLVIPCASLFIACEDAETPPEFDGAKTFRYDFRIHGRAFSYVIEVPAETYEGESRLAIGYIEMDNEKRIELGSDFYEEGQEEINIAEYLYFDLIDNEMQYSKTNENIGFNDASMVPSTFIPSYQMIEGNYTPNNSTLTIIQQAGYAQNELILYGDGTCSIVGKLGTYYPLSLSDIIIIDNDTKKSTYVKLDSNDSKYKTNFQERVYGTAQLGEYYDLCFNQIELKFYTGDIGGSGGYLTKDDKYFLIKDAENLMFFGEYTVEENLMTITVKDYEKDGQVSSLNAVLSIDDSQGTFTLVSAD